MDVTQNRGRFLLVLGSLGIFWGHSSNSISHSKIVPTLSHHSDASTSRAIVLQIYSRSGYIYSSIVAAIGLRGGISIRSTFVPPVSIYINWLCWPAWRETGATRRQENVSPFTKLQGTTRNECKLAVCFKNRPQLSIFSAAGRLSGKFSP